MALERMVMGVSPQEKTLIEAAAAREGVSVSVFMYRRIFNRPDATRQVGRPKSAGNDSASQAEGLFDIAV